MIIYPEHGRTREQGGILAERLQKEEEGRGGSNLHYEPPPWRGGHITHPLGELPPEVEEAANLPRAVMAGEAQPPGYEVMDGRRGWRERYERHLIISDLHYRNYLKRTYNEEKRAWDVEQCTAHDPQALSVVERFMEAWQPTHLHYNGDLMDMHQISRFEKEPGDSEDIEQDFLALRAIFKRHRRMLPDAQFSYELGNHEERWLRYMRMNAVELRWLTSLTFQEMLDSRSVKVDIHPYKERVPILPGVLEITHGDKARNRAGATAQVMLDQGISGVSGHTHRLGVVYRRNRIGAMAWAESGCLCRLDPEYLITPDWCQGFIVIYVDRPNARFHMDAVPIINGRVVYAGEVYEGR